jgi:hypothetical protein
MVEAYVKKVSASGLNGQQIIDDIRAMKESLEKEGK